MDSSGQHVEAGAVQPFNQPVRLRVVRCSSGLDHSKKFTDLSDDIRFEVVPLVRKQLLWGRETEKKSLVSLLATIIASWLGNGYASVQHVK